jgi:hypothetical protein
MAVSAQVEYESRVRLRYGVIAFVAALLIVGSQLVSLAGQHASVSEMTVNLLVVNENHTGVVLSAALNMIGVVGVGITLFWLYRVARARRPEASPLALYLVAFGSALAGVLTLIVAFVYVNKAHQFATTGNQTFPEANKLLGGGFMIVEYLSELGLLLLALSIVWVSLGVLRCGLVTRATGYVGVLAGALFLFPIFGSLGTLIQAVWLAALALTIAKHWPSGDPPAWNAGEAIPWPQRARPVAAANQRGGRGGATGAQQQRPSLLSAFGFGPRQQGPARGAQAPQAPKPPTPPRSAGTAKRKRRRN